MKTSHRTPISLPFLHWIAKLSFKKEFLESDDVPAEYSEDEEGILDALEQAFRNSLTSIKKRCKADKKLPSLEELLNSEI